MLLLNHFTEKFDPAFCKGTCDNCASTDEVTEVDLTNAAIQFVKLIQEAENRHMKITGPQSTHAFRGTSKGEMTRRAFDTFDHFAKGSDLSIDRTKRLLDHLVAREILTTELEDAPLPNRAPISYVYVRTYILLYIYYATTHQAPCSSGPRQRSFSRTGNPSSWRFAPQREGSTQGGQRGAYNRRSLNQI
jgi:superfamily II DNA helicase RecQ